MMAARTPARIESRAQRRPDRALLQILDARRQRARAQDHRQILGLLLAHAAAADFAGVADGLFNIRNFLHLVVEHHSQPLAHMRGSEVEEPLPALTGQLEVYVGLAILVGAGLRIAQILTSHRGNPRHQIPGLFVSREFPEPRARTCRIASGGKTPPLSCSAACSLG